MYDLVLNSADVLRPTTQGWKIEKLNIGIKNGKINIFSHSQLAGLQNLDLTGLTILPGLIDSQVHFREPGLCHKEDIESGTRAAALGGITCVFEMPNTSPPTTTQKAFEEKVAATKGRAWVDMAFYIGADVSNIENLALLEQLPGCCGVKVFMGSSTGTLLVEEDENIEKILRHTNKRVTFHSEDEAILRERKQISIDSKNPVDHSNWRSPESSYRATERLLNIAQKTNRQVHVLHVTTAEEMRLLSNNKHRASVEVLPQHLTLFAPDCYEQWGTLAQQNPPIREKSHQDALWTALLDGTVDVIGSDHAPHTLEEKQKTYPQSPSGMPGVQTTVPLMLNHVANGKLPLWKFVELMSIGPRKIFGLKNKGQMLIGEDADFTIVDLKKVMTIEDTWLVSKSKTSPFVGKKITGWPVGTIIRGNVVVHEGQLIANPIGNMVEFHV